MNHLVSLNAQAGELEKILSGVKTMLVKEFDPTLTPVHSVNPGDSLYFLREKGDCVVRVKATVVRTLPITNNLGEDISQILKEIQPKLQFTEDQFTCWSALRQALLVEFDSARKVEAIQVVINKVTDRSDWIAFEAFTLITE